MRRFLFKKQSFFLILLWGWFLLLGCADDAIPVNTQQSDKVSPRVMSALPSGSSVPVSAKIEVAFSEAVDLSSFSLGSEISPSISGGESVCVSQADCTNIRFSPSSHLDYATTYTASLTSLLKDLSGNGLANAPHTWLFTTEVFTPPQSFKNITIDGAPTNDAGDVGESSSIGIDSNGTIHIVYFSNAESIPKHAFCSAECELSKSWSIQSIDEKGSSPQMGRDINLAIEGSDLHVSYRDVVSPSDAAKTNQGVLKYALGVKPGSSWIWTSPAVVVYDDTNEGVTDTHIQVESGNIHITYRYVHDIDSDENDFDVLAYATCNTNCSTDSAKWLSADVDSGLDIAASNHLFVTSNAIHLSYYFNGTLKYARCLSPCTSWSKTVVDNPGTDKDVARNSSIAVESSGEVDGAIHITYSDSSNGDLKYARCIVTCTTTSNWQTAQIDTEGEVGQSNQLVIAPERLHVSYRDSRNRDLMYATCLLTADCLISSNWTRHRIDAVGDVGSDTALAVQSNSTIHLSSQDRGNLALKYASGIIP